MHVVTDCVATTDEAVHVASLANLELVTAGGRTAGQLLAELGQP